MTHVSIVILHYNTPTETHACLASLRAITERNFHFTVIVVDNASREPFILQKAEEQTGVVVVRSESNLGFSGGNNLGIQYAIEHFDSDFVCLLNSDTLAEPTFLDNLLKFMGQHPTVGVVSPLIYFAKGNEYHSRSYSSAQKGSILWFGGGSIDWRNVHAFHRFIDEVDYGQVSDSTNQDFLTGCCMLVRREVLEKVGGFDDRYFLYMEDVDLCTRIRRAGYELGVCASAHIWHENAGSSGGAGSQTHVYYQTRNRLLYFWQYATWPQHIPVVRWMLQRLLYGKSTEHRALLHAILQRYGKESAL